MLRAMSQISRESLTTECFGFDPYLQHQRMKRASLAADAQQLSGVLQKETGIINKVKQGAKIALSGRRFMDDVEWAMFTISEGRTDAEAQHQAMRIRDICLAEGERIAGQHPKDTCRQPIWAGEQHGRRRGRTLATGARIGTALEGRICVGRGRSRLRAKSSDVGAVQYRNGIPDCSCQ